MSLSPTGESKRVYVETQTPLPESERKIMFQQLMASPGKKFDPTDKTSLAGSLESPEATAEAKLFIEIFQETCSGDVGFQIRNGPMFRCHSVVLLAKGGGFLHQIRKKGHPLPPSIPIDEPIMSHETFILNSAETRKHILKDIKFSKFSQITPRRSACNLFHNENKGTKMRLALVHSARTSVGLSLNATKAVVFKSDFATLHGLAGRSLSLFGPGISSKSDIAGAVGSVQRPDCFALAERYEVPFGTYEQFVEILRFIYCDVMYYFDEMPNQTEAERREKVRNIKDIFLLAEKYSIDTLFEKCLRWFRSSCAPECGMGPFADAFYQLEHYIGKIEEKLFADKLRRVIIETLSDRKQYRAVTKDGRWSSLNVDLVEAILDSDSLAIVSESEILVLAERWNSHGDKSKQEMTRLLRCYREEPSSGDTRKPGIANRGKPQWTAGNIQDIVHRKLPRSHRFKEEDMLSLAGTDRGAPSEKEAVEPQDEFVFALIESNRVLEMSNSLTLTKGQAALQQEPFDAAGNYKIRLTLSQPHEEYWLKRHKVFFGVNYGATKYFGYLCEPSDYGGIFFISRVSSACPSSNDTFSVTGSSSRIEVDLALDVEAPRISGSVSCTLHVMLNNAEVASDKVEISSRNLLSGPGLRFHIVPLGLVTGRYAESGQDDEIDVQIAWLGGSSAE
ncbi:hypothetical protein FOL47_005888 [Perkinsus chesapeaki]|uniref:BACK domain-containing protein n=1 Tax=Perkinsus chesapeaki TaxID=330153 RepID=A0A7J6LV07_PERCH|nr:hypothetical protein FOL47_005888 [Perkinsus chesapeaki]